MKVREMADAMAFAVREMWRKKWLFFLFLAFANLNPLPWPVELILFGLALKALWERAYNKGKGEGERWRRERGGRLA